MDLEQIVKNLTTLSPEAYQTLKNKLHESKKKLGIKWVPNPGPQTRAYFCEADELFYGGQAGGGKELAINTSIPTPYGFSLMGDIVVGDEVLSSSGLPVKVIAVSEIDYDSIGYEIEFDTGEKIICEERHLWFTASYEERANLNTQTDEWRKARRNNRPSRAKEASKKPWVSESITKLNKERVYDCKVPVEGSVRTTKELIDTLYVRRTRLNHSISVTKPIELNEKVLPIEPYLLGLWLGDGHSDTPTISMAQEDIEVLELPEYRKEYIVRLENRKPFTKRWYKDLNPIKELGVYKNKHIPTEYLRSSKEQRIALLQGLMDTDGSCDKRGQCELGFSNERLTNNALELISSLGIKATIRTKTPYIKDKAYKTHYRLKFIADFEVFRLPRKRDRQKLAEHRATTKRRYITNIKPVGIVPMKCIRVANDDGMYLVGQTFIPTHNSQLLVGLSTNAHKRSLILRRYSDDARSLADSMMEIVQTRKGWNGQLMRYQDDERLVDFGGCKDEDDKQRYKGDPHDLIGFDEIPDFSKSQYLFITAWNRTTAVKQRCRIVCTGNPPTTPEGLWVIERWAAWLDPLHPNPAKDGELRWYTNINSKEVEVQGRGPHIIDGEQVIARSRTFIRAKLSDNPELSKTDYDATLAALPEELRLAYREGKFDASLKSDPWQCIPTDWIKEAQSAWEPHPTSGVPMCAMGVDVASGGDDFTVIACRYDAWFAPLIEVPGKQTPKGSDVAALVVNNRRDGAIPIIDMGGGYGNAPMEHLEGNNIKCVAYKGAMASTRRTKDGKLGFTNIRTEAYWTFREALDPSQAGGSAIRLPVSSKLLADLTAPHFKVTAKGVALETKESVVSRLGRSCDYGDAVIMAWFGGQKGLTPATQPWGIGRQSGATPQTVMGHRFQRRVR